jgi:hypothetical protein
MNRNIINNKIEIRNVKIVVHTNNNLLTLIEKYYLMLRWLIFIGTELFRFFLVDKFQHGFILSHDLLSREVYFAALDRCFPPQKILLPMMSIVDHDLCCNCSQLL